MSVDVEPGDTEGQLLCIILYKRLEHPLILVSAGVSEPVPHGYQGTTVLAYVNPLREFMSHTCIKIEQITAEELGIRDAK